MGDFILDFFTVFSAWIVPILIEILDSILPPEVKAWLQQPIFAQIAGWIGDVSYFIPIYTVFGIISTTVTLCASIRLIRWVLPSWLGGK